MIVRSGVTVSCPLMFGERKRPYLTIRSYGSPNWAHANHRLPSCDIMQHCVIRRVRPTNSKLTVVLSSRYRITLRLEFLLIINTRQNNDCSVGCHCFVPFDVRGKKKTLSCDKVFGSPNWARTSDIMINSHALYRLSYRGICFSAARSVVPT